MKCDVCKCLFKHLMAVESLLYHSSAAPLLPNLQAEDRVVSEVNSLKYVSSQIFFEVLKMIVLLGFHC